MKKQYSHLALFFLLCIFAACSDNKNDDIPEPDPAPDPTPTMTYHVEGYAELGAFNHNSTITVFPLDKSLAHIEKFQYSNEAKTDYGLFSVVDNMSLNESLYFEVQVTGNFFNGTKGRYSEHKTTLRAINHLENHNSEKRSINRYIKLPATNVNIFTQLTAARICNLLKKNPDYDKMIPTSLEIYKKASEQALKEMFTAFSISDIYVSMLSVVPTQTSFSQYNDPSSIMAAVSNILLTSVDEEFLDDFFKEWDKDFASDGRIDNEDIKESIRKIAIAKLATPVLMGSALKNSGIQPLLDAICDYLPSPLEAKPLKSEAFNPDTVKTLVFKVMLENNHRFSFVRIYNGILKENSTLYNINLQKHERIDHIYKLHADYHERVKEAYAGDLIGVIGMKTVQTGHTLSNDPNLEPYEDFNKYQPVISLAFEPKNSEEADILDNALAQYTLEDPTLLVNNEEGFRLVSGMGELHLSVLAERIEREYKIKPRIGNPQVILKESINNSEPIQASYRFERELGDKLHQGHAEISLQKRERGQGNAICLSEQAKTVIQKQKNISKEDTVKTVEDYCLSILESGNNNGLALADIEFTLVNILENENTSLVGIQNALHFALREAYAQAKVVTLYPIMKLEISVPEENLGAVMNLLNTCKAKIEQLFEKQNQKSIVALAPMQELFGFATNLRSSTQGRASLSMQFLRYDTL